MSYRIAGIDVHKKMLAVAVADVEIDGDFQFERQKVGTTPIDLRRLADGLVEHEVDEVVMESTAQYWRPVWEALEQCQPASLFPRKVQVVGLQISGGLHRQIGLFLRRQRNAQRLGNLARSRPRAG